MVGRRVLAAAVGAWLSVFIAAPAFAAGPRAGGAGAAAVNLRATPLAIVPMSVFSTLASLSPALQKVDSSLGDASVALDVTNVNGALGDANVYHQSDATSQPVVVNVKALATALGVLQDELNSLPVGSTVTGLQQTVMSTVASLTQGSALQPYLDAVNNLATSGSFQLQTAHASFPNGTPYVSLSVIPANATPSALQSIIQTQALAPYTAAASDGDATANHTVEATSSLDALNVLNMPAIPLSLNAASLANLNALISNLEAALATVNPTVANQVSSVTGTVSSTLSSTLSQVQGTVGTVAGNSTVNSIVPAGTPVSDITGLLTSLIDLKAALTSLPTSLDLSNIVATKDVASDVKTTVTNGTVDSLATTKAADIKVLTINAPQLAQALNVAQGSALAEITGATATAEAIANGKTSSATGHGQFTTITLLPGSLHPTTISFDSLTSLAGCQGAGSTCTITAGPLQLQILTGACACIDQAHGGTADAASAQVSALELKLSYLGNLNTLLGLNGTNIASPAALALPGNASQLLDLQLATVNANAGNQVQQVFSAQTGSPYGVGLLVGFLMLIGALGLGITYRRFAAVKVRG